MDCCLYVFILSHDCPDTACRCHLGLLCHAFSKISRTEGRVALRYHPRRKVRYKVQTFQGYNACRHQITGGEETVLQVGRHCLLAGRDCGQVFHLDAQHDVEKEQYIEAHEVEHGPVEMYRQVTCQPFCPGTFPFGSRENAMQRPISSAYRAISAGSRSSPTSLCGTRQGQSA